MEEKSNDDNSLRKKRVCGPAPEDYRELAKFEREKFKDLCFKALCAICAFIILFLIFGIIYYLYLGSKPSINNFGISFLFNTHWNPVTNQFGAVIPIYGTIVTSCIALLIGIPISLGIALFILEIAPISFQKPLRIATELLAGIPSIIYGMWGLFVFAPWFAAHGEPWLINIFGNIPIVGNLFQGPPIGIGFLTAGIILGIMVIPFMASVMLDVFEIVPHTLIESAYALGSTRFEVIRNIVLPYSRVGAWGAVMLGLGRALGETMAVAFVIGNAYTLSPSLLSSGNSIASVLANEFTEATSPIYTSALIELGLILLFISFVILIISKVMLKQLSKFKLVKI